MRKTIFSLALFTTFLTQAYSQDGKGFIAISIGPSFPLGNFASKNVDYAEAGMADMGTIFDISFAHKLGNSNFGISALLRGQANPSDPNHVADKIANEVPEITWEVESDIWEIGALLFGGYSSFPISEKTSFDAKAMIGFSNAKLPGLTITGTGYGESLWVKQISESAQSFAFLISTGFKFNIGRKLYLLTNLDYFNTRPEFINVEIISSNGVREIETGNQLIETINLSVGLALKL